MASSRWTQQLHLTPLDKSGASIAGDREFYQSALPGFSSISTLLVETLFIDRGNKKGHARTDLFADAALDAPQVMKEYFCTIDRLREKRSWSISIADRLYFGADAWWFTRPARVTTRQCPPKWHDPPKETPLRWDYTQQLGVEAEALLDALDLYADALVSVPSLNTAEHCNTILVPIASGTYTNDLDVPLGHKLGACFIHYWSNAPMTTVDAAHITRSVQSHWMRCSIAEILVDRANARAATQAAEGDAETARREASWLRRESERNNRLRASFNEVREGLKDIVPALSRIENTISPASAIFDNGERLGQYFDADSTKGPIKVGEISVNRLHRIPDLNPNWEDARSVVGAIGLALLGEAECGKGPLILHLTDALLRAGDDPKQKVRAMLRSAIGESFHSNEQTAKAFYTFKHWFSDAYKHLPGRAVLSVSQLIAGLSLLASTPPLGSPAATFVRVASKRAVDTLYALAMLDEEHGIASARLSRVDGHIEVIILLISARAVQREDAESIVANYRSYLQALRRNEPARQGSKVRLLGCLFGDGDVALEGLCVRPLANGDRNSLVSLAFSDCATEMTMAFPVALEDE